MSSTTKISLKLKLGGDIRRLSCNNTDDFTSVRQLVAQSYKLPADSIVLKFVDDEGDLCTITNDEEVLEAFSNHSSPGALTILVTDTAATEESSPAVAHAAPATASPPPEGKHAEVKPEGKVEPIWSAPPGRSDRDGKWRSKSVQLKKQKKTWKQSSGRKYGPHGYELGDVTRTFHRMLVDPQSNFHAAVRTAERGVIQALNTIGDEGKKIWKGEPGLLEKHLKQLAKDAETEGKKLWKGEPPYGAYYASLESFVTRLREIASKMLQSKEPYDWQTAAKRGAAKSGEIMQIARKEATALRKKFMDHARKEADKIFREAMAVTKQMVNLDWKLAIDNGIKDAKAAMNDAKTSAKDLVKMAKEARRRKKRESNADSKGDASLCDSSDSADEDLEVAKAKSRDLKQEARAQKEAQIREVRAKANHQRQATLAKARTQARLLKDQMMSAAATEAKQLRKSVIAAAREEAKKVQEAEPATAPAAAPPSAPPAYARVVESAPGAPPAPFVYQQQLDLLAGMGFADVARNKDLLMRHKGNLPQVCNVLIGV